MFKQGMCGYGWGGGIHNFRLSVNLMVFPHTTCDLVKTAQSSPLESFYSTAKKKKGGTTCLDHILLFALYSFLFMV